jgi:hypothetical protein
MTLRLNGTTSGYTEIDAPLVAGNNTIVLPSSNGSANQLLKNGSTAGSLEFSSNVFIDSSGRLGVGTSSPTQLLTVGGTTAPTLSATPTAIRLDNTYTGSPATNQKLKFYLYNDGSESYGITVGDAADFQYWAGGTATGIHRWFTSNTERMRIFSNGNVSLFGGLGIGLGSNVTNNQGSTITVSSNVLGSGAGTHFIKWSNTTGVLTFDTSSRLVKEDIVDCPYGIDALKLLQPRKYFRNDDQREEIGFIADEVVDVMPEYVPMGPKSVITKDEQDTEEIPLGVNYDKLTAVLTKALQEAVTKIETLEAKVTALEVTP